MARRFRLDVSTAYGQLILLVFLPICVLAMTGGILVWQDTSRAARVIQQSNANSLLNHYQTVADTLEPSLEVLNQNLLANRAITDSANNASGSPTITPKKTLSQAEINALQAQLQATFQNTLQNNHLLGMAIVNEQNQILVSFGDTSLINSSLNTPIITPTHTPNALPLAIPQTTPNLSPFSEHIVNTPNGYHVPILDDSDATLYGKKLEFFDKPVNSVTGTNTANHITPLWLLLSIDNEPLKIARYQVVIALAITGLLTILLLLLSLNVYSRRWIAPMYELRLHLQRTNATNLYKPMTIESSGELNELQQDLVKTLRRLHTSFQELKNHAEQTEDDLRLAFDEMEMQNISIRNARDAAVSASQTKSAFLANISHELRTPLNSIDGFINLLSRHGGLSAEQDLYVQTIRKSSAHLLALVNDVLDFSKIEAGKLVLDNHEFDLYAIIYDVVDMLSPLAAEKDLRLAVMFYDDVPRHLLGDALRVKQVLTNLVNNAIKFTDDGEVVVRVSLDDEDDLIEISVQDTGRGITPDHRNVLFQSFSQGDPSITRQYGGTGLGLVISKQLIFLMGGGIGFFDNAEQAGNQVDESGKAQKIKGTTFWFTLPMRLSNSEEQRLLTQEPMWQLPTVFEQFGNNSPLSMLVWIEHLPSVQVLRGSLRELPIEITLATSLPGLLEQLKELGNRWDWVIVDNHTSEDTTSLLKQVRLHYAGRLALFGYQINLDPELLSRYQARPLYQPLDRRQLYQMLDTANRPMVETSLPQWHGFRVLAVDDHPPNLLVLEALLAELGIAVVSVNSGFDAIDYMQQQFHESDKAVDLIFMDIQMPRMSGSEAATRIRQLEAEQVQADGSIKHLPIVALTAHSLSDERDKLLASGIDDYVGKPISQVQLLQILQRWLGKNSTAKANLLVSAALTDTDTPLAVLPVNETTRATQTPTTSPQPSSIPTAASTVPALTYSGATESLRSSDSDTEKDPEFFQLSVIDWEDALMRVAGKTDLASNLLIMMIDSVPKERNDLQQAWQKHDRQELANVAHRILGASRYTGVPQLRYASQKLEDKSLLNVSNVSPAQFAMLTPYYEQLLQALDNVQNADLSAHTQLKYARLTEDNMNWKMF